MDLRGIGGVWPAALTPFDATGGLDPAALAGHLRDLAATRGVRAVVVNGHAGEVSALDRAERRAVVAAARAAVGPGTGVVAGIVADAPREAADLARDAAAAGADALLLFPPAGFAQGAALRPEMAVRFADGVAQAAGLPLVLFQLSLASGLGYPTPLLARLCRDVPAIIAVKEGSDSPVAYEDNLQALRALGRPVTLLTTNNGWLMGSLAIGGDGILSGLGSVAADILADLDAAMRAGDLAAARRAAARLHPLTRAFYRAPGLDAHNRMKTALHLLGRLPHPDPRPPLLPIEADERRAIRGALIASGLLAETTVAA